MDVGEVDHPRPIAEVLSPKLKDQRHAFDVQFAGMAFLPFTYDDYGATRQRTGWLKRDDGFLVLDANANQRIDSIAELAGSSRVAVAANDNGSWRGATFRLVAAGGDDEFVGLRPIGISIRCAA